jgi:hypothetical protein
MTDPNRTPYSLKNNKTQPSTNRTENKPAQKQTGIEGLNNSETKPQTRNR